MNQKTAKKTESAADEKKSGKQKCKKCGSGNVLEVEYNFDSPEHYDGVSEFDCQDCHARIGRWSGKELAPGEVEKRYGRA
jgi:transposase-like protein